MDMTRQANKKKENRDKNTGNQVFKLLHRTIAGQTILHGETRRSASHIAYLRFDTLLGVTRDCAHGLFTLEISECRLFDKKSQMVNQGAQGCGKYRTETRLEFACISGGGK